MGGYEGDREGDDQGRSRGGPHLTARPLLSSAFSSTQHGSQGYEGDREGELKRAVCAKLIGSLAEIATKEVVKSGIFTLPGLCRIKTRMKPATKAGKREVFG